MPPPSTKPLPHKQKGALTRQRILDAAELLFAARGFDGASLRWIAERAGIREPGLYNYFDSKRALYAAVLDRALAPMLQVLQAQLAPGASKEEFAQLPATMTDLLLEHPRMAAFFQQALRGDPEGTGVELIQGWLDRLFRSGLEALPAGAGGGDPVDRALLVIAMFNLCTGYFLSEPVFEKLTGGHTTDPRNVERQKQLLGRIVRAAAPD